MDDDDFSMLLAELISSLWSVNESCTQSIRKWIGIKLSRIRQIDQPKCRRHTKQWNCSSTTKKETKPRANTIAGFPPFTFTIYVFRTTTTKKPQWNILILMRCGNVMLTLHLYVHMFSIFANASDFFFIVFSFHRVSSIIPYSRTLPR